MLRSFTVLKTRVRSRPSGFFYVFAEADESLLKVCRSGLPNLPDIEVDEAHREHVIGEEGELVLAVDIVHLKASHRKAM